MISRRSPRILGCFASLVLLIFLIISGCASLFIVGVREIHWDGMYARQEGSRSHPETISSFSQLYYSPDKSPPPIKVRMPDGEFLRWDKLNRDALNGYVERSLAHEFPDGIGVDYRRGTMTIYLDDTGHMKDIIIDIHPVYTNKKIQGKPPAIGLIGDERVLEFPLQEDELKEVFGEPTNDETYEFGT